MQRKAVIYTRVSTEEQADQGYSLSDQESRLRQYCKVNHYRVLQHFQDDCSAKNFDRPKFQEFVRYVEQRQDVNLLLFIRWDRFSRSVEEGLKMVSYLREYGVEVQAVEQPIDLSIPENKAMFYFYLAIPEIENDRRSLNTRSGMRRAKREGRWVSTPPKGYDLRRDERGKSILVPNEEANLVTLA